jgi:hypothetical protein
LQWYRDYLRRDPQAKNAAEVQAQINVLEKKLMAKGVQQLTVRSRPKGATVLIDEQPMGVTPWTGDIPPGRRHITLRLKGFAETSRELELPAESAVDVEVRLVPAGEAAPTPPPAPVVAPPPAAAPPPPTSDKGEPGTGLGLWPYITLAAGGAVLGGALTFEILRRGAEDDAKSDQTQIGYADKYDTMESHQTMARVLAGVGGALAITGGVMLVLELTSDSGETAKSSPGSGPAAAQLGFGCDDRGCGLSAHGRF